MVRVRRCALFLALCLSGVLPHILLAAEWSKLEGCTLVPDEYRDGDSFHVRQVDKDFIFRLYFVDAPETDSRFPDRDAQQAKYFGISAPVALSLGKAAEDFTANALSKPFTVWTKFQDARGSSRQHRFYAIVKTTRGSLAELLIANGLARVFGMPTALPDGGSAADYIAKLKTIEAKAKATKRGGWNDGSEPGFNLQEPGAGSDTGGTSDVPAF